MTPNVGRSKKRAPEINVTPLVDVVLVLLIIFMVATPMVLKELAAVLPRVQSEPPPPPPGPLLVGYRAGVILLNRQPVTESELLGKVQATLAHERNRVVLFDIDDDAAYQVAVHLMDVVRGAGARTLALVTKD